jgi:hypothetical protein
MVFSSTDEQFAAGSVVLERVHIIHTYATPVPVRLHVEKKGTPLEVILLVNITASQDIINRPMMVLNPQVGGWAQVRGGDIKGGLHTWGLHTHCHV